MKYIVVKRNLDGKDSPLTKALPESLARRKLDKLEENLEEALELVSTKEILTDLMIAERRRNSRR
jgi:hypothetical protein